VANRINIKQLAAEIAQQPTDDNSHLWRKGDKSDGTRRAVTVAMNMHSDSDGIIPHIAGMVEREEIKPLSEFGRPPVSFAKFAESPADWFLSAGDAENVREFFAESKPDNAPIPKVEPVSVATPALVTKNKLRRNSLDPAIDKAIRQAGSIELAAVYLELKAMALDEVMPFTGALDGDALCYTDDENNPAKLTKGALGKRLSRR